MVVGWSFPCEFVFWGERGVVELPEISAQELEAIRAAIAAKQQAEAVEKVFFTFSSSVYVVCVRDCVRGRERL